MAHLKKNFFHANHGKADLQLLRSDHTNGHRNTHISLYSGSFFQLETNSPVEWFKHLVSLIVRISQVGSNI